MAAAVEIAAAALGVVMTGAVLGKVDAWGRWANTMYRLVPRSRMLARRLRYAIPVVEGIVALLLFAQPIVGLVACAVLLGFFAVAVALLAQNHAGEDCACFGTVVSSRIGLGLAVRDAALAAIAGGLAAWTLAADVPAGTAALSPLEIFAALFAGVVVAMTAEFMRTFGFEPLVPRRKVTEA
jgi:Methylamine utilisation protein MauE